MTASYRQNLVAATLVGALAIGGYATLAHAQKASKMTTDTSAAAGFRLYAPTEAYFDRSWPLPDIEKAK
jgi:hypothetical protein